MRYFSVVVRDECNLCLDLPVKRMPSATLAEFQLPLACRLDRQHVAHSLNLQDEFRTNPVLAFVRVEDLRIDVGHFLPGSVRIRQTV